MQQYFINIHVLEMKHLVWLPKMDLLINMHLLHIDGMCAYTYLWVSE